MGLIKNIHLLEDISDKEKVKMEHAALEHNRHNGITFKIVDNKPKSVSIQITQSKNSAGVYHPQKRLIEIVHETYDRFFADKKVHVHAIPFIESPANKVNVEWVNKKMFDAGIKLKDIAADTGIDYTQLSSLVTGDRNLSQPMKALFYYYFLSKK